MYKVKWYRENGIYEASGGASANSLFFESKDDHVLFQNLWQKFLGDMVDVIHYSFTEVSWAVIFETKSKVQILKAYESRFQESKKVKKQSKLRDIGRIVSQSIRLCISNYVAESNRNLGRQGSRVKRRFSKFGFIDTRDYHDRINTLERMEQLYKQKREKYRPNESYYDEQKELGFDCVFRSASAFYRGVLKEHFCFGKLLKYSENSNVLRYQLATTFKNHFHKKPPD